MPEGVELIAEGELIYLVASEDKEQKMGHNSRCLCGRPSMAAHAGGGAIAFPGACCSLRKGTGNLKEGSYENTLPEESR